MCLFERILPFLWKSNDANRTDACGICRLCPFRDIQLPVICPANTCLIGQQPLLPFSLVPRLDCSICGAGSLNCSKSCVGVCYSMHGPFPVEMVKGRCLFCNATNYVDFSRNSNGLCIRSSEKYISVSSETIFEVLFLEFVWNTICFSASPTFESAAEVYNATFGEVSLDRYV